MTDRDPTNPETLPSTADANNVVPLAAKSPERRSSDTIIGFVRKHPVLTVAGGVAAGLAISAFLPRKAGRKLLGRAVGLAEAAGAASMMIGRETTGKARSLGHDAKDKAGVLASRAEKASEATAARLEKYGLAAIAAASALGRATARRAEKIGDAAAEKGHHLAEKASELKQRVRH